MLDPTKERILDAAAIIIREQGSAALTVEAAADLAGVSRKTVYNHFENKYALIDDAASAWTARVMAVLADIAADEGLPFITKLNKIVERAYAELKNSGRLLTGGAVSQHPRLAGFQNMLQERLRGFITDILQNAINEGYIKKEFSSKRLTYVIVNFVIGLTVLDGVDEEAFSRVDVLKDSLKAMVGGILTDAGTEAMRGSPIFE
ncbi:DNA-binding transcriptional regulator UidR [Spirochaetota bacterium]